MPVRSEVSFLRRWIYRCLPNYSFNFWLHWDAIEESNTSTSKHNIWGTERTALLRIQGLENPRLWYDVQSPPRILNNAILSFNQRKKRNFVLHGWYISLALLTLWSFPPLNNSSKQFLLPNTSHLVIPSLSNPNITTSVKFVKHRITSYMFKDFRKLYPWTQSTSTLQVYHLAKG